MLNDLTKRLVTLAIEEDLGSGDVTTDSLIEPSMHAATSIVAKELLTVCGHEVAAEVFKRLDPDMNYVAVVPDGAAAMNGEIIAHVNGRMNGILKGERTALNFLQHLSGISTHTRHIVNLVGGAALRILDTRKTTPGHRELEKYAVRTGGGTNHRFGLFDAVLIKNNHIDALEGDVMRAVQLCRKNAPSGIFIQVEVRDREELEVALRAEPDGLLLDNIPLAELDGLLALIRSTAKHAISVEASGGISEGNIKEYVRDGLHSVSLGSLTHSARAVDISLRYDRSFVP